MAKCCGGASCACVLDEGDHLSITGSGTSQDPFILTADVDLNILDNTVFNLTLGGTGTVADPWELSVAFASTAKLDDIPDVNAPGPITNAHVLGWDNATSRWTPRAPTTAASGSVQHDTSLSGDGSGGSPLLVVSDENYDVTTRSSGIGLTDAGRRQLVRRYANVAARTADAVLAPALNSLSILDDQPGVIWYWTGSAWSQVQASFDSQVIGTAFLQLSGAYSTQRLTRVLKKLSTSTDGLGSFDVLTAADLAGRAGVLGVQFTATDTNPVTGAAYSAVLFPNVSKVSAIAYRLDDGTPWGGVSVTGLVEAWVY